MVRSLPNAQARAGKGADHTARFPPYIAMKHGLPRASVPFS